MAKNSTEVTEEEYATSVFEEGDGLVVNLEGIEELSFDLIPKGIYDAVVDELTFGKSKSSGAPMFTWVFQLDGGDFAGRKLYYYTSFSPKALKGTKTALLRIDSEVFAGAFNPAEVADSGNMLGKKLRIKIKHDERQDNGEMQAAVAQVMPAAAANEGSGSFLG